MCINNQEGIRKKISVGDFQYNQYSLIIIMIMMMIFIIISGVQTFMAGYNPSMLGEIKADVSLCAGVHYCVAKICFLTLRSS